MSGDLFGFEPPAGAPKDGEVQLALVFHREGDAAWLLAETEDIRTAKWVPKSQVRRGEGRDENVWTVPEWMARDRGWL